MCIVPLSISCKKFVLSDWFSTGHFPFYFFAFFFPFYYEVLIFWHYIWKPVRVITEHKSNRHAPINIIEIFTKSSDWVIKLLLFFAKINTYKDFRGQAYNNSPFYEGIWKSHKISSKFTLKRKYIIYVLTYVNTAFPPILSWKLILVLPYLVYMSTFYEAYYLKILLAFWISFTWKKSKSNWLKKKNGSYN